MTNSFTLSRLAATDQDRQRHLGRTRAVLTVDEATADVDVHIVPDDVKVIPLLIGKPFTEQSYVTIIRRKDTFRIFEEREESGEEDVTLRNIQVPDLAPRRMSLWAKEAAVIPPNYVGFVTLYTSKESRGHIFLDRRHCGRLDQDHGIMSCVLKKNCNEEYVLPVANVANHEFTFKEGERVVRAEWCNEKCTPAEESVR
ncbi:unnamed protein product [Ixodes pacificus]